MSQMRRGSVPENEDKAAVLGFLGGEECLVMPGHRPPLGEAPQGLRPAFPRRPARPGGPQCLIAWQPPSSSCIIHGHFFNYIINWSPLRCSPFLWLIEIRVCFENTTCSGACGRRPGSRGVAISRYLAKNLPPRGLLEFTSPGPPPHSRACD